MSGFSVFLPSYSVGTDAYSLVSQICSEYGKKAVVIGGKTAMEKALSTLKADLNGKTPEIIDAVWYGGDSSFSNVKKLAQNPAVKEADMIFAMGGGRCLDTCKVLAHQLKKPVFTFPTIASNCAPITVVSVMYDENGVFSELAFQNKPATHAFINTDIISNAPEKFLWAGIGDALSKQYECVFSARGDKLSHTNALGEQISRGCAKPLLTYGKQALEDVRIHKPTEALEQVALAIIISTGLTSVLVDNDYNSNLAHSIYYGCTVHKKIEERHLHGELVSYGTLVLLTMDKQTELLRQVFDFNKSIGLPTCLADIEVTEDMLDAVLDKVMQTGDIVHSPYEITREKVAQAIAELERFNHTK